MTIAFKARVDDPAIASYRYRVLAPIAGLRARGHDVEVFSTDRAAAYGAVVFSKTYSQADRDLARSLKAAGRRVVLDLCDNHLYNPAGLPKYEKVRAELLEMIGLADRVICSTPVLAAQIAAAAGLGELPAVAHDAFEQSRVMADPPSPMGEAARLLWFGRHGSPNAEAGMADVSLARDALVRAYAKRPFKLTICSDNKDLYRALFADFPVPTRYVSWTPEAFDAELAATDGVILPLSDNPFVAAKTHNRLTLTLSAGVPVVGDAIPSYGEFAPFAYLDAWDAGLEAILLRPEEARRRAAAAAPYLRRHWSDDVVAGEWAAALDLETPVQAEARPAGVFTGQGGAPSDLAAWLTKQGWQGRPWLLAGDQAPETALMKARREGYAILSLGRLYARFPCDAAFIVDIETFDRDAAALAASGASVLMPREPHCDGWASGRQLDSWALSRPALAQLKSEGRLLTFDLWTAGGDGVEGDFEGEEVPLRLLVGAGVGMARHLGVRAPRAAGFESAPSTLEGRGGIPRLRRQSGLSYGPYGYPVPARVFVGSDDEQLMGVRVLEYSIQKFSTMDVVVETLDPSRVPVPKDPKNKSKTGFSFCRFEIPALCGYQGRGVYVDADMQLFTDITDLWTLPMETADVLVALTHPSQGRTPQTSVMLLNCEALPWKVDEVIGGLDDKRYTYKDLMRDLCIVPKDRVQPLLPHWWNSLERFEPGRTSLIHYTDMPTQPWISPDNRNGGLWYDLLLEAVDEGFIDKAELDEATRLGHISPSLFRWAGRSDAPVDKTAAIWVAPYHRFTKSKADFEGAATLSGGRLIGWAYAPDRPDEPVRLGLFRGEEKLLEFAADEYADILQRHGKGDGRHVFDIALPSDLASNPTGLMLRPLSATETAVQWSIAA